MENNGSLINSKLGKYVIQAEIGRGGMGTVYRGYDPILDRNVAVKVLAPHLVWQTEFVERFLREARSAARINHPNIVTIHDVGQEAGWYYFVMEYLEGQSLTALLQQQGSLDTDRVIAILQPLAAALQHAHHSGLVHRDIKPSNIVISPSGHVTLTDFGIARAAQEVRLTNTGTVVGTPEYMSPEQAQSLSVDARSDQYSLAVMAYRLLSGRVPFEAETTLALMYKVVHEPPPPLSQSRPDLPPGVAAVLNRAMAKQPGERYPDVVTFVEELKRALEGKPVTAAPAAPAETPTVVGQSAAPATPVPSPRTPPPQPQQATPVPQRWPRSWWWIALLALGVVAALAGVFWPRGAADESTATVTDIPSATPTPERPTPVRVTSTSAPAAQPSPTASPSRTPTDTATPTRKPTATSEIADTATPEPTETATATPTPVPVTPTPTRPSAVTPQLVSPPLGGTYKNPIVLQWNGSLGAGQAYLVTMYHKESGHTIQSDSLSTTTWTVDVPGDKFGEWGWRVDVVANGQSVTTSEEWMFWFNPGFGGPSGGDTPQPQPSPTRG